MIRPIRWLALVLAGWLSLSLVAPAQAAAPTYTNDVSASFADTYADPAIIQGKDGWWYAYATADPLRSGEPSVSGHITRTRDFRTWNYVGPIFTRDNRPSYATPTAGLWAPDVRYIQGRYVMYYTVTDTTLNPGGDYAIGVATADSPAGPWIPADQPIVAPRGGEGGNWFTTIDPSGFTDTRGNQYLYFGGYFGGIHVTRVSADGLTAVGQTTQLGHWDRYEGSYVVEHDGWYYLMASSANCCAGPATGYSVFAGRSRSPMGPFLDHQGRDMNASITGGTLVLTQNGNRWIGAGHNAMFTDASGRDYMVYHAIDKNNAWLDQPFGVNRRPMLIDPIDWIDGWPVVNAAAGPSDRPMAAPVTSSLAGITPWNPAPGLSRATTVADPQGGESARLNGTSQTERVPAGDLRVRFDLASTTPTRVVLGARNRQVKAWVDPVARTLTLSAAGRTVVERLPRLRGWTTVVVEVDRGHLSAYVSAEDLADPAAILRLKVPGFTLPSASVRVTGNGMVDNLTLARPALEATRPISQPVPGATLFSQDFARTLDSSWSWVRPDADITTTPGGLRWPLKAVDVVGTGNTGALLLREAPVGDWIAETRFSLDLGSVDQRNHLQAGMIVHHSDDNFARLGSVAIWGTRTIEYGRELPGAPDGRLSYGGAIVGTHAPTMWMRIAHHTTARGERLYRAGISTDGTTWTWGATMTFAPGTSPRIGLYAGGGARPATDAVFDYFRITSATASPTTWPG